MNEPVDSATPGPAAPDPTTERSAAASQSADARFIERRAEVRIATHFPARLCYGPRYSHWADCVVKDLSVGGAKVELGAMYKLPRAFVLLHFGAGLAFEAVRRWRRADLLGVSFEACHDLNLPIPPRLALVHQTWLALRP